MEEKKDEKPAEAGREDYEQMTQEEFTKLLDTPMGEEEARKAYADLDVDRMSLMVVRQKWQAQITDMQRRVQDLDLKLTDLDLRRAIIFRRALNQQPEEAK